MGTDFSAFDSLADDLRAAPAEAVPFIVKATKVSSHEIRDEAREEASRKGLEAYGRSIGYDVTRLASSVRGEIGPTPGRRQSTFGFVEGGGEKVRSQPQHALRDAKDNAEPGYFEGLQIALSDGLDKAVGS